MTVVKTLALGASILGSMVAPTLAGSMRSSHQIPERHHRESHHTEATALNPTYVPSTVHASQENLAILGSVQPAQSYVSSFSYMPSNLTRQTSLSLGYQNAIAAAASAAAAQPVAAAPIVAQPVTYTPITTPVAATTAAAAATTGHTVDAFINFGNGAYSEASSLTTGTAQSWSQSPSVQAVYHGVPTAAQQLAFQNEVLQVVQNTYSQSGLHVSLTTDPTQNYAHTMSVVSGASFTGNSAAIGITDVGNDGFSFIDKINLAKSPDELAEAVGHNIAHELMHAFGISGHPDQTGSYLDAATANWSVLTNAQTSFSPQAAQMLAAQNFLNGPGKEFTQGTLGLTGLELLTEHHPTFCHCPYCNALHKLEASEGLEINGAAPVPEPTTVALWGCAITAAIFVRRQNRRRSVTGFDSIG